MVPRAGWPHANRSWGESGLHDGRSLFLMGKRTTDARMDPGLGRAAERQLVQPNPFRRARPQTPTARVPCEYCLCLCVCDRGSKGSGSTRLASSVAAAAATSGSADGRQAAREKTMPWRRTEAKAKEQWMRQWRGGAEQQSSRAAVERTRTYDDDGQSDDEDKGARDASVLQSSSMGAGSTKGAGERKNTTYVGTS